MLKLVDWLILPIAAIASLISVTALFSEFNFVFDLVSHFRLQYIAGLVPVLLVSVYFKRYLFSFLFCTVIGIHSYEIISTQIPLKGGKRTASGNVLRVMSANLQASNSSHELLIGYVREVDPDILVVQEMTQEWYAKLSSELAEMPHYAGKPQPNPFGIGVFSKLEFESAKVIAFSRKGNPSIKITVINGGKEIVVIGTHSLPPITANLLQMRNEHLQNISEHIAKLTQSVILVGDLNTTPWSAAFKKLIDKSRLRDSRRGFGIHPTWPAKLLPVMIPIDHILVSESVDVVLRQVSGHIGSDHRSVWVDIALEL